MTRELRDAIGLLRFSNSELASHVAALAETNPFLQIVPPATELRDRVTRALDAALERPSSDRPPPRTVQPSRGGGSDATEWLAAADAGLTEHVRHQINMILRAPRELAIADHFIDALEPSGWLGRPLDEIATLAGCTVSEAEAVLLRIQQIEPAGLLARSLAECLALQAQDRGMMTEAFAKVLGNLEMLARGDLAGLARLCGGTEATVRAILVQIRSLDPKPGACFDPNPQPLRDPDITVRRRAGGWLVELTRSTLPGIVVLDHGQDPEAEAELRAARWLERAVARRNTTSLRIAEAVVAHQADFLAAGPAQLRPMALADLAARTGLHESTISRVVAGLLMATPRGTFAVRMLFGAALPVQHDGAAVSAMAMRHRIAALIAAEDPRVPLSDSAIAAHFAKEGITLARRTVAKYREAEGIAASSGRRNAARLNRRG